MASDPSHSNECVAHQIAESREALARSKRLAGRHTQEPLPTEDDPHTATGYPETDQQRIAAAAAIKTYSRFARHRSMAEDQVQLHRELELYRELLREFPDGAANATLHDVVEELEQRLRDHNKTVPAQPSCD
jgi:hypothetical protein